MQPQVGCFSTQCGYLMVLVNRILIVHTLLEMVLWWYFQSTFFFPQSQFMDAFTFGRFFVLLPAVAIQFPCCFASSCFFAWYCRLLWMAFLFTSAQVLESFFSRMDNSSAWLISSLCDLSPSGRNSAFKQFSCSAISPSSALSEFLGNMTNHCNAPVVHTFLLLFFLG
uniref:Uncharacterized protein n=2 Tax=Schistocephalus solidus TaxID=70667 RepID=A0A0X3P2U9_SCHSO